MLKKYTVKIFRNFHILQIIYWDDQSVFMEHRFIRPSDQFVHCIAICRQRIIDCSAEDVMNELLSPKTAQLQASRNTLSSTVTLDHAIASTNVDQDMAENGQVHAKMKPDLPPEIQKWIEYNDLSSKNLRQNCWLPVVCAIRKGILYNIDTILNPHEDERMYSMIYQMYSTWRGC